MKSPAWNSEEGSPKCFLNLERADGEDVSATPISWFPGRDAMYGVCGDNGKTFRNRRYSASHLLSKTSSLGTTFYRPIHVRHP